MIAVDTHLPVYAHREEAPWHDAAYARLAELAEGRNPWAIPWPCLHEFLAIVTHPRTYAPPTSLDRAVDQVEAWLESPSLILLAERRVTGQRSAPPCRKAGSPAPRSMTPGWPRCAIFTASGNCGLPIGIFPGSRD